jgi:hypothetical protein
MKNKKIKSILTALSILALSQPMFAAVTADTSDYFEIENEKSVTIDVQKFTDVWLKLHVNNGATHNEQKHLQEYLENSLDDSNGKLDVTKFSDIWSKAGNRNKADHLTKKLDEMVEHASQSVECSHK